jgi:hypothetical protein
MGQYWHLGFSVVFSIVYRKQQDNASFLEVSMENGFPSS